MKNRFGPVFMFIKAKLFFKDFFNDFVEEKKLYNIPQFKSSYKNIQLVLFVDLVVEMTII
jgi:chromosomal replication initiation ATPase DnaA